jgi:hypothetical protein
VTLTARTIKTNSLTAAGTSGAATDALGSSATLALPQGSQGALAVISGTFTATLQFEAQGAGGTWIAAPAVPIGTSGAALVSSATAAGNWLILAAGALQVRVRCSAFTSGPAVVELSNAQVGGFSYNVASPSGITDVQGVNADGGALSNPVQLGIYESSTVIRDLRAMNAPVADLLAGKGVAAVNVPGLGNSGSLAAPGTVALNPVGGATVVAFGLTGTYTGLTFTFQGSMDGGVTYPYTLNGYPTPAGSTVTGLTTSAANGAWIVPCAGFDAVRANVTALASGTATFQLTAGIGAWAPSLDTQGNQRISIWQGNGNNVVSFVNNGSDAVANSSLGSLAVTNYNAQYDGNTNWVRVRAAQVFKVVALGAGTAETTIWTPTTGKKFRLMGFLLTVGAASTLTFKDNTSGTTIFAARGTTDTPIAVVLGNGILSAAANNVLTVTRGTSATLDGVAWGTEE